MHTKGGLGSEPPALGDFADLLPNSFVFIAIKNLFLDDCVTFGCLFRL